uniref:2-oxoglutarate dehydrogenase, mitochondrial n=1 Tax=Rhizochromulina marina TaxID=1034831 RepID=A0A7S2S9S3_9STRA|mmetsp:Transcript_27158/g.79093  ORF Transcript_27158/g.79093 Transcript_27158/m.79093 type:complete len:1193 (+) Transcript_27158:78-3656(+)
MLRASASRGLRAAAQRGVVSSGRAQLSALAGPARRLARLGPGLGGRGQGGLRWRLERAAPTVGGQRVVLRAFAADADRVIQVPEMGDSINEGTVLEFQVEVGALVKMDDVIAVLETDKVQVDVRSPVSGRLMELYAGPDDVVQVGSPFFKIDISAAGEADAAGPTAAAATAAPAASAPVSQQVPTPAPTPAPAPTPPPAPAASTPVGAGASDAFSTSIFNGGSAVYVDSMFDAWKRDPSSVHQSWNSFFQAVDAGMSAESAFTAPEELSGVPVPPPHTFGLREASDTAKTIHLIQAYQRRGHEMAILDPLGLQKPEPISDLDPTTYGFNIQGDWERGLELEGSMVNTVKGLMGNADINDDGQTTLHELVDFLQQTYCGSIGVEVDHLQDLEKLNWLRSRIEVPPSQYSKDEKRLILERLAFSEKFETILGTRFQTAKRFGLEGLESVIPGLKTLVDNVTSKGVDEVVIGMPHRGRLNVLANVVRKPMEIIFKEFKGVYAKPAVDDEDGDWSSSGDVKYHLGTSFRRAYPDGRTVQLELLPNPSHLEAVNPLVVGKARAKMDLLGDETGDRVLPVVMHGDAAFAGQGVVYETMQMARLDAYQTGGTVNVICNNQIGFTATPQQGRSTRYASDLGKAFNCPVFHVNADDVEAVCRVFELAADWRQTFHQDVVIDLIGYRKHGHNEIDEPTFTQPLMYERIGKHPKPLSLYQDRLLGENSFSKDEVEGVIKVVDDAFNAAWDGSDAFTVPDDVWLGTQGEDSPWKALATPYDDVNTQEATGLPMSTLQEVGTALTTVPEGFTLHRTLARQAKQKAKMFETGAGVDWATAESLAIGTLLLEGFNARMTGQDVERGTFSHRHALVHDQKTAAEHVWVNNIRSDQKNQFYIANSLLSEYAVLGFELGYSFEHPNNLVLWEAQFGDFVNGAQIIIDQFLSSGEAKWMRQSGLVMLLPHGYQGAGPEHSSCRIERFLQCSDEDPDEVPANLDTLKGQIRAAQKNNWQVVNPSTPANYFHVLRRQMYRQFRKPLIIPATKALLRHRLAVSNLDDFGPETRFQRVIDEAFPDEIKAASEVQRVVFCSGKLYYELLEQRREAGIDDVAIVRIEQLSPFPFDKVAENVKLYSNAEVVWAQEEPKNMGCWYFVQDRILTATRELNGHEIRPSYVGRKTMASPAEGWGDVHTREQNRIITDAMVRK